MKQRNQKRKTYLQLFLHKAIPTMLVYGIFMLLILSSFCQSQQQNFLDNQSMEASVLRDYLIENDSLRHMSFRLASQTFEQTDMLQMHAWVTDAKTEELVASSDKILFWAQTNEDTDGEKTKNILRSCDYDSIKDQLGEYIDNHPQNAFLSTDGYVYPLYPLKGYEKYLYYYDMKDVYYTDTTFYPGTLYIKISEETTSDFQASLKQIASLSLTPENPEDYIHMSLDDKSKGLNPVIVGDSYSIEDFPLVCDNLNVEPTRDICKTSCTSKYADMYIRYNFTDATGHAYRLHYAVRLNYWATAGRYICFFTLAIALFILGIVALLTKKDYNTLHFFYQMSDYRKSLMDAMAHDLKTPLMAMSGYAENLKENVNTKKREHYANAILENTNYMNKIISRNLTLSEFESMTELPRNETIDMVILCKELAKKYESAIEEKKCSFTTTGSYLIQGNKDYLSIALDNLLSNAVKYANVEGSMEIIGAKKQFVIANTTDQKFEVPANKLWDSPTGLGLAIVKSILTLHKLRYKITLTKQEHLTRFTITIQK